MSKYTKYRLYQKYETRGSQEAIPCYPNIFSIDGDGTQTPYIVEENSRDCGYTGDTQPIYRWYNMPIDKYYVCDACQDYENHYLTLVAKSSGTFKFTGNAMNHTYQYSTDEGYTWTNATSATTISVSNGNRVMFKNGTLTSNVGLFSASTANFEAEGNVMSLLYGDNFIGKTSFPANLQWIFWNLFKDCHTLKSINNLKLPATTLAYGCYGNMFEGCTSLTSIPSGFLPATTLAETCYEGMFYGCTSLTSVPSNLLPATTVTYQCYTGMFQGCTSLTAAPELPATTLAELCYNNMFQGCTSLTTAPDLSATTLEDYCYNQMFKDCTSLNYIKCLATDISATYCLGYWLYNVSSSGTFVRASNANWPCESVRSVNTVPSGWDIVPPCPSYENQYFTINLKEISPGSYGSVTISGATGTFQVSVDEGQTWDNMTSSSYLSTAGRIMFRGNLVPSSSGIGRFHITRGAQFEVEGNIMSLLYGDNFRGQTSLNGKDYAFYRLFSGCTTLTSIDNLVLPATTLAKYCYGYMFCDCTSLTSIPSGLLPATTMAHGCYFDMFAGCTSLSSVPINLLPATTLAQSCYAGFFMNCSSLATVQTNLLQATTLADFCYEGMFIGCTSLTTAPVLLAATLPQGCYGNMFNGCSSLSYVKCLATDISANQCTNGWLSGVASSGTFVKKSSMSGWSRGVNGIPSNWTVQNA